MITIVQKPSKFSPSENLNIFQIESDNSAILYFNVEVKEAVSNATIGKLKIDTTSEYPNGGYINLSGILQNLVDWEVNNGIFSLVAPITKSIASYKVTITEMGVVSGAYTNLSAPYTLPDTFTVWNSKMDKFNFGAYSMNQYVINNSGLAKFLTYKPLTTTVNQYSSEQLYFLYDGTADLKMKIAVYDSTGTVQFNYYETIVAGSKMYRLQTSIKALLAEGITYDFLDGDYYTIEVVDLALNPKTEKRKYIYQSLPCHYEPMNIFFVNSIGGVDSYQFVNPQDSLNVSRSIIKKNTFKLDDGIYSDKTEGTYNVSDEIYASNSTVSVKAYTRILDDSEVYWLGEMISSKQLFIELSDGTLVPTMVTNTNYAYQRQKYKTGEVNVMQFEFSLAENIIPALSNRSVSLIQGTDFYNVERSASFKKNDCDSGETGTYVTITVPAGTYVSKLSVADANSKADEYIEDNGQTYANSNGSCTVGIGNEEQSETFFKNDCPGVETGTSVEYVVPADTFFGEDLEEANDLALADIAANGQDYANDNGTCSEIGDFNSTFTNYSDEDFEYLIIINDLTASWGSINAGETIGFDAPVGPTSNIRVETTTHSMGSIIARSNSYSIPMTLSSTGTLGLMNTATCSSLVTITGGIKIFVERVEVEVSYTEGTWDVDMSHPMYLDLEFLNFTASGYDGSTCTSSLVIETDTMPSITIPEGSTSGSAVTGGLTAASIKYRTFAGGTLTQKGAVKHNVPFLIGDTPMRVILVDLSCNTYTP